MAEEIEYYWDEDSQTYYYWDDATQSYYMYVEEGEEGGEEEQQQQQQSEAGSTSANYGVEQNSEDIDNNNTGDDAPFRRGFSRKMSFRDYGGLAGCLQQAATDRLARKSTLLLTDDEIKREARLQLARDMAATGGGGGTLAAARQQSEESSVPSSSSYQYQDQLDDAASRSRRRSTTSVRFGTQEFNDPAFQEKLEAMLGSNVRKPR